MAFFYIVVLYRCSSSSGKNSFYEFLANLTLCFGLLPNADISVIGVGWFIGLIFVFYMLFPFFCYMLSTKKKAWISFGGALAFNILCSDYFFDTNHVLDSFVARTNIVYCAMFFFAGGLIYLYRNDLARLLKKYKWVFFTASAMMVVFYYRINNSVYTMLFLFSLMVVYGIGFTGKTNRFVKYMSGISMEIYLCHMAVFRAIEKGKLIHIFSSDVLSYITVVLLTLTGAVLFAAVVKRGIMFLEGTFGGIRQSAGD